MFELPSAAALQLAFTQSFEAVAKLFLITALGFVLYRKKLMTDEGLAVLLRVVVDVLVPVGLCLALLKGFSTKVLADGSPVIITVILCIATGFVLASGVLRMVPGTESRMEDRSIVALSCFQNSIYLPLPLALSLVPRELQSQAALYVGLAVLATNPLQWTMGTFLVREIGEDPPHWRESLKKAFNLPLIGVVSGALLSFLPGLPEAARQEPAALYPLRIVFSAMDMLAVALGPISNLMLGAMVGACRISHGLRFRPIAVTATIKLLLLPLLAYVFLGGVRDYVAPMVALVAMIEAASPSAVNLALQAKRYGGEWGLISALQLPIYCLSLATLPIWVALELAHFNMRGIPGP